MNTQISPTYSYVGYCKSESDWLLNNQSITRCFLGDFKLSRMQVKGYDNVLQLGFKFYSLEVAFDSMTKMDQWYNILQKVSGGLEYMHKLGGVIRGMMFVVQTVTVSSALSVHQI